MSPPTNVFSEVAREYADARPRYPAALFEWIAGQCPRREAVWDCATGNGQAAVGLAPFFAHVSATDSSEEQISHGLARDNIAYSVQGAEKTIFPDHSFDAIVVAQALHWFDFARFWPEVSRVARSGALFCAWGYVWPDTSPEVDEALVRPFRDLVAPFWAPNNKLLWDGYQDDAIAFPFERIPSPAISLEIEWNLDQLVAYLQTWSAAKRSRSDPATASAMDELFARSRRRLPPREKLHARMPLAIVAGRVA